MLDTNLLPRSYLDDLNFLLEQTFTNLPGCKDHGQDLLVKMPTSQSLLCFVLKLFFFSQSFFYFFSSSFAPCALIVHKKWWTIIIIYFFGKISAGLTGLATTHLPALYHNRMK
jgi:hypothetical protein